MMTRFPNLPRGVPVPPPSQMRAAFLLGAEPDAFTAGYTRSLCMFADAPFVRVRLWFFNWGSGTQVITHAMVGTGTRRDQSGSTAGGLFTPDGDVADALFGGLAGTTLAAAVSANEIPTVVATDWVDLQSATPSASDAGNPLLLPIFYGRSCESSGASSFGSVPNPTGWQSAVGDDFDRVIAIHRSSSTTDYAYVAGMSGFASGSPTNAWCVPEFEYTVPARTVMVPGDSTDRGTGSTNNGDRSWPALACFQATSPSGVISPFIIARGGRNTSQFLAMAESMIDQGVIPHACVIPVCSPNDDVNDTFKATVIWGKVTDFIDDVLTPNGITPILRAPLPQHNVANTEASPNKSQGWRNLLANCLAYQAGDGLVIDATTGLLQADPGDALFAGGAPGTYTADGIHPNNAGYAAIANVAEPVLAGLLA